MRQLFVAVGAIKPGQLVHGDFKFRGNGAAAIERRQAEPAFPAVERNHALDGWMAVEALVVIHETFFAGRTGDMDGEYPAVGCRSDLFHALKGIRDDFPDLAFGYMGVIMTVHHDGRTQGAGPKAVDRFKGDFFIGGGFTGRDLELLHEFLGNGLAATDMAGRSQARGN